MFGTNYLPKPLTADELKSAISEIMSGMGDLTIKDMGKVIELQTQN